MEHEAIAYCRQFVTWLDELVANGKPIPPGIGDTWHAAADMLEGLPVWQLLPRPPRRIWVHSITADTPEDQAIVDEMLESGLVRIGRP